MIHFFLLKDSNHNRENGGESDSSGNDYHDAMEDEAVPRHRSDIDDEVCLLFFSLLNRYQLFPSGISRFF